MNLRLTIPFLFGCLILSCAAPAELSADVDYVVSPSGFADVEGNSVLSPYGEEYPNRPPASVDGYRAQNLISSDVFLALGPGPFRITGLAYRPDISVDEEISTVWQTTWRLGTTTATSLGTVFDNNIGPAGLTQVYSGSPTYGTDGVPRGDGLPHDFDYAINFDVPFRYDPSEGNLLLEFDSSTFFDGSNWIWADFHDTGIEGRFVQGGGQDPLEGFYLPGESIIQFEVTADCDFNGNGSCDIEDIDRLIMEIAAMTDDPNFDLSADGFVNVEDRDLWLQAAGAMNLESGNPYLLADFNLDGIVDGLDFIEWNANKFMATGKWSLGDANADGITDGLDFILWNGNKFMSSDGVSVPEPSSLALLVFGLLALARRR